jgi:hypothetical protein
MAGTLMKNPLFAVSVIFLLCVSAFAQQPNSPATATTSQAMAPEDISGMYSFQKEGEFVQITVEESGVTGFISRYGDAEDDKGTFLDQFFSKATLKDKHLTFTTKKVHGVWYDFEGNVDRGPGKTPHDEGYRIIRGTLTQSNNNADNKVVSKSREIEMKSFPQDLDDDVPQKKP